MIISITSYYLIIITSLDHTKQYITLHSVDIFTIVKLFLCPSFS